MKNCVPVQLSIISEDYIREYILNNFQFENIQFCDFFHNGTFQHNYIIKTESGKYWFRVFIMSLYSREQVEEEIKIINYASESGIAVSIPVQRNDAQYISEFNTPEGIRYGVLFTDAPGKMLDLRDDRHLKVFAGELAKFHIRMKSFPVSDLRSIDNNLLIKQPLSIIKKWTTEEDYEKVNRTAYRHWEKVEHLLRGNHKFKTICHGDLNPRNLFINQNKLFFIDFEACGPGYRAYDLACFKRKIINLPDSKERAIKWLVFLNSYMDSITLHSEEIEALDYFMFFRSLWVMSLVQKSRISQGNLFRDQKYVDKHLLHMKFFTING